jgi:hypothetical protein
MPIETACESACTVFPFRVTADDQNGRAKTVTRKRKLKTELTIFLWRILKLTKTHTAEIRDAEKVDPPDKEKR